MRFDIHRSTLVLPGPRTDGAGGWGWDPPHSPRCPARRANPPAGPGAAQGNSLPLQAAPDPPAAQSSRPGLSRRLTPDGVRTATA